MFIQAVINFILVAFVIFFALRAILAMEKELGMEKEKEEPALEPEPSGEVKIFIEIRDQLKDNALMIKGELINPRQVIKNS